MEPVIAGITHTLIHGSRLEADLRSKAKGDHLERARKLVKKAGFGYSAGPWWVMPHTRQRYLQPIEIAVLHELSRGLGTLGVLATIDIETQTVAAPPTPTPVVTALAATVLEDRSLPHSLNLTAARLPWASPGGNPGAWIGSKRSEVEGLDPASIERRIRADIDTAVRSGQLRLPAGVKVATGHDVLLSGWSLTMMVRYWPSPFKLSRLAPIEGLGVTDYTADVRECLATLRAIADRYSFCNDNSSTAFYHRAFGLTVEMDEATCCEDRIELPAQARLVPTDYERQMLV